MRHSKRIRDLFNNYLLEEIKMPKKYYDISDEIENLKKDISEQLSDKYIDKLEKLCQKFFDMNDIDVEESFVAGYSLGTQLTAEAFDSKI